MVTNYSMQVEVNMSRKILLIIFFIAFLPIFSEQCQKAVNAKVGLCRIEVYSEKSSVFAMIKIHSSHRL